MNDRQKTIVGRSGLGLKQTKASFEVDVRRYLTDYSKSDSNRDLVFDTGYSNEERKFIHMFVTFKLICKKCIVCHLDVKPVYDFHELLQSAD